MSYLSVVSFFVRFTCIEHKLIKINHTTENNKGREPGEVDLHGLRAEEAVERTDVAIQDCRRQNRTELRLIVGE